MVGPDVARSRIVRQVAERGTFIYRVSDAHTKQVSNVKVQGAATSEPVIGMKEQRGGIPPHGRVRGSVWTDARRTQCTWIRTPLRHPAEAVHAHRREPKEKKRPLKDDCRKFEQERFAQTIFSSTRQRSHSVKALGSFFGFCATNMPASLVAGHELNVDLSRRTQGWRCERFSRPETTKFYPGPRGRGELNPGVLTGAVATLLIIDILRVKSIIKLITDHPRGQTDYQLDHLLSLCAASAN